MGRGAAEVVRRLNAEGRLGAIGALGGTGGTAIATKAMRALPIGVPKLMVSTVAAGDTSAYVGTTDLTTPFGWTRRWALAHGNSRVAVVRRAYRITKSAPTDTELAAAVAFCDVHRATLVLE